MMEWRRIAQRVACGLLAASAAVAIVGIVLGRVEVPGPMGTELHCSGHATDFPELSCGYERLPSTWHALLGLGSGMIALVLAAGALVLARVGVHGGRRGVIAGIGGVVVAVLASFAIGHATIGDFIFSFRGNGWCEVALYALVATFFAGLIVLVVTLLSSARSRPR